MSARSSSGCRRAPLPVCLAYARHPIFGAPRRVREGVIVEPSRPPVQVAEHVLIHDGSARLGTRYIQAAARPSDNPRGILAARRATGAGNIVSPKVDIIIKHGKLLALPREAIGSKPITYRIGENNL